MRLALVLGFAVSAALAGGALAQTAAAPAPSTTTEQPAAPAAKPKKRAAGPPAAVTVTNASKSTATEVVITADEKTAKTSKPLAPKAKATVKLPKLKGCMVSVAATFEGEGQVDAGEHDVCKDRNIRFTD